MKKVFKIVVLGLVLALALPSASSKAQLFDQGDMVLSAGIGLGSVYYTGLYYKTTIPPIWVAGDYCLREKLGPGNLGVGGYLGYSAYKWEYSNILGDYGWKYSTFIIAGRGTYHFTDLVDNLDLYGGMLLGAKIVTSKEFGDTFGANYSASGSGVAYSFFAGARYMFSPNFGATAELGYGIAYLSLGVSFKL